MKSCKEKARAKINLTLDILGTDGGYHTLDSFVTTLDLYDLISVRKRKDEKIRVLSKGEGSELIPESENNAYKAAQLFRETFQTSGADIAIYKNIPIGAGLGGSSADAAGMLRALKRLYLPGCDTSQEEQILHIADSVGSDVRALYLGGFCRMSGRGETIEPVWVGKTHEKGIEYKGKRLYFLLLYPRKGINSGEAYKTYDTQGEAYSPTTQKAIECYQSGDLENLGKAIKNDLTAAACTICPDIETALNEAKSFSPLGCCMTGSGSAVFALFDSREMAEWAKSRYKGKFRTMVLESEYPLKRSIFSLLDSEE